MMPVSLSVKGNGQALEVNYQPVKETKKGSFQPD